MDSIDDRTTPDDRRAESRVHALRDVSAQIRPSSTSEDDPGIFLDVTALDISTHGLRLCTAKPMLIGATVHLHLRSAPTDASFVLGGKVRWVMNLHGGDFEVGLRLDSFSGEELNRWIDWLTTTP